METALPCDPIAGALCDKGRRAPLRDPSRWHSSIISSSMLLLVAALLMVTIGPSTRRPPSTAATVLDSARSVEFLGTVAAWPVPRLGCSCALCRSAAGDSRRSAPSRSCLKIGVDPHLLVDMGPDVYNQLEVDHTS
ncbi:MAG: hypothetical protein HY815_33255 [Candidatus Riflebacteria bacterium]|nr:hypothetical protein [Candidatus Riflebacteria bacterium]